MSINLNMRQCSYDINRYYYYFILVLTVLWDKGNLTGIFLISNQIPHLEFLKRPTVLKLYKG